jgi:hypothetical protein
MYRSSRNQHIDGLSEQQILDKLTHMMMVSNSYVMNHDLSQPEVMDLLVSGFTGTLQAWWEKHLTDESKASIRKFVKTDEEGIPIFNERVFSCLKGLLSSFSSILSN